MSVVVLTALALFGVPDAAVPLGPEPVPSLAVATEGISGSGALIAQVTTASGAFVIELAETEAPVLVANFVALARGRRSFVDSQTGAWVKRPFYDGLLVHRIVPGFAVQIGCPRGDGRGGPGFELPLPKEASLRHELAGTVSMVGTGQSLSGSQFFITLGPEPHLDGRHGVMGRVVSGLEVIQKLAKAAADRSVNDRLAPRVESVTISRKSS